jgi:hypothetical protein
VSNKVSFIIQLKDQFGRVAEKVNRQFKSIKRSSDRASKSVGAFARRARSSFAAFGKGAAKAGAIATAALTVPIGLLGKRLITTASDADETANKFAEVFKGIGPSANKAVADLSSSFKLATSTSQELLSNTGDLLVGLGLSRKEALKMSADVVRLSADVASFKNVQGGAERASNALTKALLGEREMLKETFKTAVLESEVKKRAAVLRLKNTKLTVMQAKALATLAIVTDRNKDAIGDFNRTQEAYANIARTNQEANKQLSESFGRLLLPLAVTVTKALTRLAQWLEKLSPRAKKLVLVLTGLVAIGGPLLLLLAGIAVAFSVISLPLVVLGAAVLALVAAGVMLWRNWEGVVGGAKALWGDFSAFVSDKAQQIRGAFTSLWAGMKPGIVDFINFGLAQINRLLAPLDFVAKKLGFEGVSLPTIALSAKAPSLPPIAPLSAVAASAPRLAPSAPVSAANGTINGQITVAASPGSTVRDTSMASRGSGLNLGVNMVAQ